MGEWSNLTQREKSNIIRFAIKNGVSDINTIRDTFNVYAGGGHLHEGTKSDSKLHIPTREEYITQKLDSIQNAALEASRRKTQAQTTPVNIEQVYGKGFVKQLLQGYVDSARAQLAALKAQERQRTKSAISTGFVQGNVNTQLQSERLANAEEALRLAEGMLSGEIEYTPQEMNNCIANLSEFFPHGLPYGNESFAANPGKWGFSLIDTWDVKPGDLVQHIDAEKNRPHHAMIYNGVDDGGLHTFNYSNGLTPNGEGNSYESQGYGVGKHYPEAVSSDKQHLWNVNVYRYTGTPQDSVQWTNEWLQQYPQQNEFAEGGDIHIKPSKRGTFTAAAKKHGKSVQEFARQVLAHKENYSPAMVKKANFARNAAGWKHSTGGPLYLYPFSFSKNPYWKTPVVRYDNDGVLGHQYGFGDFLKKLFRIGNDGDATNNVETKHVPTIEERWEALPDTIFLESAPPTNIPSDVIDRVEVNYAPANKESFKGASRLFWNRGKEYFNTMNASGGLPYRVDKQKQLLVPLNYNNWLASIRPQFDYIGGSAEESRKKAMDMLGMFPKVKEIADLYGINPNLLMERISHEGLIDTWTKDYNDNSTPDAQRKMREDKGAETFWNNKYSAYSKAGMDTLLQRYIDGKLTIKDKNVKKFYDDLISSGNYIYDSNEKGTVVLDFSATPSELFHLQAAYLRAAQDKYAERVKNKEYGDIDLDTLLNAMYNLGEGHKDLMNTDWVKKNYTVGNWY